MIRPPCAGATPVKGRRRSGKDIPGVRIVLDKASSPSSADREWDAVKAVAK